MTTEDADAEAMSTEDPMGKLKSACLAGDDDKSRLHAKALVQRQEGPNTVLVTAA